MLVNALTGQPLPIYGDGQNIRDWLYVADHCRAIDRVLADGRLGETYNVGGRNEWANIDIVRLLCGVLDEAFASDPGLARRFPEAPAARGSRSGAGVGPSRSGSAPGDDLRQRCVEELDEGRR